MASKGAIRLPAEAVERAQARLAGYVKRALVPRLSTLRPRFEACPEAVWPPHLCDGVGWHWTMLGDGEFDVAVGDDGVEVWVTQMGGYMNMNTAFIDRAAGIVAIVDPFDAKGWVNALAEEGLHPTHLLYTHTHRDHTAGYSVMLKLVPEVEVWGHEEARVPNLLGHFIFKKVDFTHTWDNEPNSTAQWSAGAISLDVTHSPGHAPGHVTLHGHGIYHAGDLLFTAHSGRVDLPGSDPHAQWRSVLYARGLLQDLPGDWRLIPGHRYEWIDGSTPDWVSLEQALGHNFSLNSPALEAFERLPWQSFDDDISA